MECLRAGRIAGPLNRLDEHAVLRLLLHLLDEGLKLIGLLDRAGRIGQGRRNEGSLQIAIEERAHARGKNESGKEILIETTAADDVDGFVARPNKCARRLRKGPHRPAAPRASGRRRYHPSFC